METFRFIEDCLGECRNHDCGEPLLPENAETTPSRLVGLGDLILSSLSANAAATQVVGSVRLVNVTRPNCPTYVALSHCWGSNLEAYKTTSTNLLQRQIGLDVQTLSPTFRDAIEICCRLQVHYIWIDALCIVQDSAEDWNTESVIMGDIYQNALFTISASHARDGLGGCFNDSCKPALDNDFTAITTSTSMGEETSILIRSKKTNYIPAQDLQESPLSKRGWVYQERFLSSRIIHFAATQVIWECRNTFRQERLHPVTTPTVPSQAKLSSSLNAEGAVFHWHQLVQDYSARGFTKYEDRLVALAGVAQICRPRINSRYLAGLWSSHLAYGLAWSRTDGNLSSPASAPRYPTWSWASQNHSVSWKGDKFDFSSDGMGFVLKSERLDLHQTARQDFGPVKGGSITIRGRAARITHINTDSLTVFGNCDIQLGDLKGDLLIDEPSNLTELSQRTPDVFALALGCWRDFRLVVVLVLVPVGVGTGTYWRVGLGNVYTEAADGATFGTGHIPETISIL